MKRFIEGTDRGQTTLLPDCLDDYVDDSNPVRAIDAFVEMLDLAALGNICAAADSGWLSNAAKNLLAPPAPRKCAI